MRHPVQRVWSYYNCTARWYPPFATMPLAIFLRNRRRDSTVPHRSFCNTAARSGATTEKGAAKCSTSTDARVVRRLFNAFTQHLSTSQLPQDPMDLNVTFFNEAARTLNSSHVGDLPAVRQFVASRPFWPDANASSATRRFDSGRMCGAYRDAAPSLERSSCPMPNANPNALCAWGAARSAHRGGKSVGHARASPVYECLGQVLGLFRLGSVRVDSFMQENTPVGCLRAPARVEPYAPCKGVADD